MKKLFKQVRISQSYITSEQRNDDHSTNTVLISIHDDHNLIYSVQGPIAQAILKHSSNGDYIDFQDVFESLKSDTNVPKEQIAATLNTLIGDLKSIGYLDDE